MSGEAADSEAQLPSSEMGWAQEAVQACLKMMTEDLRGRLLGFFPLFDKLFSLSGPSEFGMHWG